MRTKDPSRYVEDPLIRSMRVRTWYRNVVLACGLSLNSRQTSAQLEGRFSERKPARSVSTRSCIWDKYRRGEVVPRSGPTKSGRPSLVEKVERVCPGTASWFSSPLWRLADKAPMEMSELRRLYEGMAKPIRALFIADCGPRALFWRQRIDAKELCSHLAHVDNVEALIILLAFAKEAETIQDQCQHALAVKAVCENILGEVITKSLGKEVHGDLSRYLNMRWRAPGYFGPPEIAPKKASA